MSFRIDRLSSLYLFAPLQRLNIRRSVGIPILMYHSISESDDNNVHPYYRTATSPAVFLQHMEFLNDNKYSVISLSEATAKLTANNQLTDPDVQSSKNAVLTFDDGFRDFYTEAFPVLRRYGFTATVFLSTAYVGDSRSAFKGKECLNWQEVRELDKGGITLGSHTVSHNHLDEMTRAEVEQELRQSRETIEDRIGSPVGSFSYPYAFPEHKKDFVTFLRDTLRTCGYSSAVTTMIGTARGGDELFFLKRIPINSDDNPAFLDAKLAGGYDWMHIAQYAIKSSRTMLGIHRKRS